MALVRNKQLQLEGMCHHAVTLSRSRERDCLVAFNAAGTRQRQARAMMKFFLNWFGSTLLARGSPMTLGANNPLTADVP